LDEDKAVWKAFDISSLFAWQRRVQINDPARRKLAISMHRVLPNNEMLSAKGDALVRQGRQRLRFLRGCKA
jgi:hypothetical protein